MSNIDTFKTITNATAKLYAEGVFIENLTPMGNGLYKSTYTPRANETIRLSISAAGYTAITMEDIFPDSPIHVQVDTTFFLPNSGTFAYDGGRWEDTVMVYDTVYLYDLTLKFTVSFSNIPRNKDFFRLLVSKRATNYEDSTYRGGWSINRTNFDDIVFGKNSNLDGIISESPSDYYNVFSDELIDGKTHSIRFEEHLNVYGTKRANGNVRILHYFRNLYTIELQPISENYYLYLKSLQNLENSDFFMSEPVQLFTNVQNGLGLFGSRKRHSIKIDCPF